MLCGFFFLIEEDSLGNGSLNLDLNNGSCSGLERVWLVDWDKYGFDVLVWGFVLIMRVFVVFIS